jgi:mRNA-degrading endonuclease RelE of RelBE toxin-antitoxin system
MIRFSLRVPPGRYHRLRGGLYRVLYVVDGDMITVERVDRVAGD